MHLVFSCNEVLTDHGNSVDFVRSCMMMFNLNTVLELNLFVADVNNVFYGIVML